MEVIQIQLSKEELYQLIKQAVEEVLQKYLFPEVEPTEEEVKIFSEPIKEEDYLDWDEIKDEI